MMSKTNNFVLSIVFVLLLVITVSGSSYAYFSATVSSNQNDISGKTDTFIVDLDISAVKSGNLIPVRDNLIISTLNGDYICEDTRGYSLCNLYRVRLTNRGDVQTLIGYIKTNSSTYITSNLKYQLFTLNNGTYTAASDALVINHTANATNYFTLSSNNINFSLTDGNTTNQISDYYLAIWISDPNSNQLEDQDKVYNGTINFVSSDGNDKVNASFIVNSGGGGGTET